MGLGRHSYEQSSSKWSFINRCNLYCKYYEMIFSFLFFAFFPPSNADLTTSHFILAPRNLGQSVLSKDDIRKVLATNS